jgi:hypothetical protein
MFPDQFGAGCDVSKFIDPDEPFPIPVVIVEIVPPKKALKGDGEL